MPLRTVNREGEAGNTLSEPVPVHQMKRLRANHRPTNQPNVQPTGRLQHITTTTQPLLLSATDLNNTIAESPVHTTPALTAGMQCAQYTNGTEGIGPQCEDEI